MSQPFKSIASSWCEAAQAAAIQRHGLTALQAMPRLEREAAIIAAGPTEMTLYAAPPGLPQPLRQMSQQKKDGPWWLELIKALAPVAAALIGKRKAKEPQQPSSPDNSLPR